MTRINLVPVEYLADQHISAERREIKMVPAALRRSLKTRKIGDILSNISPRYTLNAGHVKFFYPRMKFLTERYKLLTAELLARQYNLSNPSDDFSVFTQGLPAEFNQVNWAPDKAEIAINVERILLRINEKPNWYKHLGEKLSADFYSRYKPL